MTKSIIWLNEPEAKDIKLAGGKGASLAEMKQSLTSISIPTGFIISTKAYQEFINNYKEKIQSILSKLDTKNYSNINFVGKEIRHLMLQINIPKEIANEIKQTYKQLNKNVAVRSSATAEDLLNLSFAGMHSTFLNVMDENTFIQKVKECFASLYSDRAIRYRTENKVKGNISMAVVVQEMVNSSVSGVAFTIDPESGFKDAVLIESVWGLGETIVKGKTDPDKYIVYKPKLLDGKKPIIGRKNGVKTIKTVFDTNQGTIEVQTSEKEKDSFTLSNDGILNLAKQSILIEKHYEKPMDIEWALNENRELIILQARPLTAIKEYKVEKVKYILENKGKVLLDGLAIGGKIGSGKVKVIKNKKDFNKFNKGDVLVTEMTDPDWMEIMMKASAIVTDKGGRTSHSAIVSRELGIPCIVGTRDATERLKDNQIVTISCAEGEKGIVYDGMLNFKVLKQKQKAVKTKTNVLMMINFADAAFFYSKYPSDGVGMVRKEVLILENVGIHPKALLEYEKLKNKKEHQELIKLINNRIRGYNSPTEYYIDRLALAMGKIAAAFYPREVIVKLTDFKSNEYRNVPGGEIYEPKETNPMIGWRSAVRYYSKEYKPVFKLECQALKKVREEMGLTNLHPMIPYCRTPEEGKIVLDTMKEFGLERGINSLKVIAEVEVPVSIILMDEYAKLFDEFQIGVSCLTQATLCLDKDNPLTSHLFNERHPAMKKILSEAIRKAHKYGKKIGSLGQAPSDYPDFNEFLIKEGIDSISLNPDLETFIKMREKIAAIEEKIKQPS